MHDFDKRAIEAIEDHLADNWDDFEMIDYKDSYVYKCWLIKSVNMEDVNYHDCIIKFDKYTLEEVE